METTERYEGLKLKNQLCFPLYAVSKEIVKRYRPYLDEIDLTYTQYITMMVLWEKKVVSVKELGDELFLDSGTLTPVLKVLEKKGYVKRVRNEKDERLLDVSLTKEGETMKEKALAVPQQIAGCVALTEKEGRELYRILYKLLGSWYPDFEEKPV